MRRSLSSGLRWLEIGAERLRRLRRQVPVTDQFSFLLTEDESSLLTELGSYIAVEQYVADQFNFILTEDDLILLSEDGRGISLG
jgi:hypothetical protein